MSTLIFRGLGSRNTAKPSSAIVVVALLRWRVETSILSTSRQRQSRDTTRGCLFTAASELNNKFCLPPKRSRVLVTVFSGFAEQSSFVSKTH